MSFLLPAQDSATARRRTMLGGVIVAALAIAAFSAKPALSAFRRLHAHKLAAEAEAYLAQNRAAEALEAARAALRKTPDDLRANRAALDALALTGNAQAVQFWFRVASHSGLSLDDHRDLLRLAVAWNLPDLAEQQWNFLQNEKPFSDATLRLGADFFALKQDWRKAAAFGQALLDKSPDHPATRILFARILLKGGSERDRAVGARLLLEQARRTDWLGLEALRQLSSDAVLSPFDAHQCLTWLEAHPLRHADDALTAAAFEAQLRPYHRQAIIEKAAKEYFARGGHIDDVCRWMVRAGYSELIPDAFTANEVLNSRTAFLIYIDSLGQDAHWSAIDQLLGQNSLPINGLDLALYRARAASELRQTRIAALRWDQAIDAAGADASALLRIADYARQSGAPQVCERICQNLISRRGSNVRAAFAQLLKLNDHDARRSLAVLKDMAAAFPSDDAVQNDLSYIQLLLNTPGALPAPGIAERTRRNPDFFPWRATAALAALKNGTPAEARKTLEAPGLNWRDWQPYQQAIYAAACGSSGDTALAREISGAIRPEDLREPERALIAPYLQTELASRK